MGGPLAVSVETPGAGAKEGGRAFHNVELIAYHLPTGQSSALVACSELPVSPVDVNQTPGGRDVATVTGPAGGAAGSESRAGPSLPL